MITNKRIFFIGIALMVIPFLGFPLSWKLFLVILCGAVLVVFSVKMSMPANLPKQFSERSLYKEREKDMEKDMPMVKTMSDVQVRHIEKPVEHKNPAPPSQPGKIHRLPNKSVKIAEPIKKIIRGRKKKNTDIQLPQ